MESKRKKILYPTAIIVGYVLSVWWLFEYYNGNAVIVDLYILPLAIGFFIGYVAGDMAGFFVLGIEILFLWYIVYCKFRKRFK